jgi:hypothetical protein
MPRIVRLALPLLMILLAAVIPAVPSALATAPAQAVQPNPRALGDPNAPLKIVYYGDYQ